MYIPVTFTISSAQLITTSTHVIFINLFCVYVHVHVCVIMHGCREEKI